jgi:hypothetical protein
MAFLDPEIIFSHVFARASRGACPWYPGGKFCAYQPDQIWKPCPTRLCHAANHGRVCHSSEAGYET